MFVMQTISPPARRIRSVTVASYLGTKPCRMRRAAGQRDAGDRDGVLHGDALAREDPLAALRADATAAHDRVERILLRARARARLAHGLDGRRQIRLLLVEQIERREDRLGDGEQLTGLLGGRLEAPAARERGQLGRIDARDHQSFQNGRRTQPSS